MWPRSFVRNRAIKLQILGGPASEQDPVITKVFSTVEVRAFELLTSSV